MKFDLSFIKTHHWHYGTIALVLVLAGGTLLWLGCWSGDPYKNATKESFALARHTDPEIRLVENYTRKILDLKQELMPYLNKALLPEDKDGLVKIQNKLGSLPVPNEARGFHMKIILKLSALLENLSADKFINDRVVTEAKVTKVQSELKIMLTDSPQISLLTR